MYLIHNDPLMFDEVHGKRVECRALNIPEELGQVQYMFCDKERSFHQPVHYLPY